jgi:hypothetical protein
MLRGISRGSAINFFQRAAFETLCESWRPHRREQFDQIWATSERMRRVTEQMDQTRWRYEQMVKDIAAEREQIHAASLNFTDKKPS